MPRLILEDDDGREIFAAPVSQSNVETVAGFLQRNMGALRAAAAFKRAISSLGELLGPMGPEDPLRRPPPLRPAPAPRRKARR